MSWLWQLMGLDDDTPPWVWFVAGTLVGFSLAAWVVG